MKCYVSNKPCSCSPLCRIPCLAKSATHQQIVKHYIKFRKQNFVAELNWVMIQPSLFKALREATFARDSCGKRLSHQRRLLRPVIPTAWRKLRLHQRKLNSIKTFPALYKHVDHVFTSIYGAGPLYCYDTALRIGSYLGISPTEVFLQAGSQHGAMKLLTKGFNSRSVPISSFPQVFRRLKPCEMENLLCIYRDYL